MVKKLSKPSRELATKLLSEVSFEKRLIGIIMHPMIGDTEHELYSLQEVADFLRLRVEKVTDKHAYINYVDLDALERWIREVLGDKELADAIREEIKRGKSYKERMESIKELIKQRLKQCKAVLGM